MEESAELLTDIKPKLQYHKKMWKIVDESMEKNENKEADLMRDINGNEVDGAQAMEDENLVEEKTEGKIT